MEIRIAIRDLSRHPEPELSGALPDVSAAVECTMLHLLDSDMGKFKEFVDELNEKGTIPPFKNALLTLSGYASQHARYGDESKKAERSGCRMRVFFGVYCQEFSGHFDRNTLLHRMLRLVDHVQQTIRGSARIQNIR